MTTDGNGAGSGDTGIARPKTDERSAALLTLVREAVSSEVTPIVAPLREEVGKLSGEVAGIKAWQESEERERDVQARVDAILTERNGGTTVLAQLLANKTTRSLTITIITLILYILAAALGVPLPLPTQEAVAPVPAVPGEAQPAAEADE